MIHTSVEQAFQEVDAAIFSGDGLEHIDFRERLGYFLKRWEKAIEEILEAEREALIWVRDQAEVRVSDEIIMCWIRSVGAVQVLKSTPSKIQEEWSRFQ